MVEKEGMSDQWNNYMQTLTKIYQTDIDAGHGDCFAACIASLTGLPIDTIPLFHGWGWFYACSRWLFERGFQLTRYDKHKEDGGYHIVGRNAFLIEGIGWRCHAVVYKAGEEAHDPISNRSNKEILAANKANNVLHRDFGILYTMVMRPINVTEI